MINIEKSKFIVLIIDFQLNSLNSPTIVNYSKNL